MAVIISPNVVSDGLVYCIDAKNIRSYSGSGTSWNDLAQSRSGTLTNFSLPGAYVSASPTSYDFDGTNDYLTLSSDVTLKDEGGWTMEHWINSDNVTGSSNLFNFAGWSLPNSVSWYFCIRGHISKLSIWNKNPGVWKDGSTTLSTGTWYQVVCVSENTSGTSYQFYVNGSAEGGDHASYTFNGSGDYKKLLLQYIGRGNSTYPRQFNGKIAISRFYNKALSSTEVSQNFQAHRKRFGV